LAVILFLVGFFVPVVKNTYKDHKDLDYFKDILLEDRKSTPAHISSTLSMLTMSQMANALSPSRLVS
jgi:hypothetical protein